MSTTLKGLVKSIQKELFEVEDGDKIFKYFDLQALDWITRNCGEPANFAPVMAVQFAMNNCTFNFNLIETKKVKKLLNNDNLLNVSFISGVMFKFKYNFFRDSEIEVTTHNLNQLMDLSEWIPLFDDDLQLRVTFGESIISVFETWRNRLIADIQNEYMIELEQLAKAMQLELDEIFLDVINKIRNKFEIE